MTGFLENKTCKISSLERVIKNLLLYVKIITLQVEALSMYSKL